MNRFISFITAGLLSLDILLVLGTPIQAQEAETAKGCTAIITDIQNIIEKGREVTVSTRINDISDKLTGYPATRPYRYLFLLSGQASESIMHSFKFQEIIAKRIIANCNNVGMVTFAVSGTDYVLSNGLMPDGTVKSFDCIDYQKVTHLSWGQEICTF